MRYKILFPVVFLLLAVGLYAQQPDKKVIRVADTLTAQEKTNAGRIILRSELDSLIKLHNEINVPVKKQEPVRESSFGIPVYLIVSAIGVLLVIAFLLYLLFSTQRKFKNEVAGLNKQLQYLEFIAASANGAGASIPKGKNKVTAQGLETKINELNQHVDKLKQQNDGLEQLLKEYNGIKQDYDAVSQKIAGGYKVKSYPGYDKTKPETETLQKLLETEKVLATYAYENFFKPVIAIADANKNNPAGMSKEESDKMVELLISLSLFYIEYLYLRIHDLSFGGTMGERIRGIANGTTIDAALLKKLNKEHGSRALVLRMVLDKAGIHQLSYPVFDETSLNNP
jgi:hypothetical protein